MINPVRLKGKPANIARYYTVGDYYTKGAEEHSEWDGKIAEELGLEGKVDPSIFKELLAGKVGDQQLGRHRQNGEIEHHPAWDFAVSAPKSISIMALVMGDERILAAHERAVTVALDYLEEHATLRRREDGEILHETTGRLIIARFTEHASREGDPHLHTHAVVLNMTNREDGAPIASLETRAMFAEQMVAGQVYRNELARDVLQQGHEIIFDPRTGLFELANFPKNLLLEYSQRGEQINEHAKEHGFSGQADRQRSFYATRGPKIKIGLDDLHRQWADRSQPFRQFLESVAAKAEEKDAPPELDPAAAGRAALFGIRQAETREAVNNRGRILRLGLASHVGEVRLSDVQPRLEVHEERRKLLATHAQTGDQTLTRGRTTRRTARLELAMTQHLALSLDDARPIASSARLLVALENAGLTSPQERALVDIATSRDRVTAIHGVAGSGKSTLVRTLEEAAEPGTTLLALAPTSSAAAELGRKANIESRTVASLLAGGGHGLTDNHVLVLDEAGQLGNRQALRVLEISRTTGARVLLLGDNKQTGAIEQGKAFWLLQKLGMPTAQLTEAIRQETKIMKTAVAQARAGDYTASLASLDRVVSGESADKLAKGLVQEWTRLKPENRANTNILVLDNATRLIVNTQIRETLKREGVVAAEDARLSVLTSSGMTDVEKHNARFYSGGQAVSFGRDIAASGLARETEYRVLGLGRDANGRQIVRLVDEIGRIIRWDPRLANARQINVFNREERDLAQGDRIQWRLVNKDLQLKNAERGTVEKMDGPIATIRWDRDSRVQEIDLSIHKTWDHGYAETVYSAQSKTYDRVYILAPVNSGLVNGQNYYTAITRAQYGVKLWTEDTKRLAQRLAERSGEKTSSLEGLGRLDRDKHSAFSERHQEDLQQRRDEQQQGRQERRDAALERQLDRRDRSDRGLSQRLAGGARSIAEVLDRFLQSVLDRGTAADSRDTRDASQREDHPAPAPSHQPEPSGGPEH